jgi:cyclopropane-fatty-acyl-phospholipid synthase
MGYPSGMTSAESIVRGLLERADVRTDGSRPWDLRISDHSIFGKVLRGGSLALGETYMDGGWDVERLDEFFSRLFNAGLDQQVRTIWYRMAEWTGRIINGQTPNRSLNVAHLHYNLGNDLFKAMLDKRLMYTCAYWKDAEDLESAQEAKLDLVCRKLELQPGMSVLDLGCGWGGFARFAAERYGVTVVGVNIAVEQVKLARELSRGLPVTFRIQDYREVEGQFDRVVSIGIMEHVGPRNHRKYMETASRCLKPDGLAFVHTICSNVSHYAGDPWFERYIFPGAVIPSIAQMSGAIEGLFVLEDLHNIGPHYYRTIMEWERNLTEAWPGLQGKYGDRVYRMMKFYLLASAARFHSRVSQLVQIVLSKPGRPQPNCRIS